MQAHEILEYIERKKSYVQDDYKLYCIFELFYLVENKEFYARKSEALSSKLEESIRLVTPYKMRNFISRAIKNPYRETGRIGIKIIHNASLLSGFSEGIDGDIAFIKECHCNETNKEKTDDFLMTFEKIVSNSAEIPSKSVIIISQDVHHIEKIKRKTDSSFIISEKKRKLAAHVKGQKAITDYFKSTKPTNNENKPKPSDEQKNFKYKVEQILSNKREKDDVQILWIPKGSEELNPVNYVSILFSKHVAQLQEEEGDLSTKEACTKLMDLLPNELWPTIFDYITRLEDSYVKEYSPEVENQENNE